MIRFGARIEQQLSRQQRCCGNIAFFRFNESMRRETPGHNGPIASALEKSLKDGMKSLEHRGPDSYGHWISDNKQVGLGHVRLSLIDLSEAGSQPMHNETRELSLIANGEVRITVHYVCAIVCANLIEYSLQLYGFEAIRERLKKCGHKFKSHSDSEVILGLYSEKGFHCFEEMRGEFAFCLHDRRTNLFIAARDRFGIKPLFYAVHNDTLFVASETKALFAMGVPAVWNPEALLKGACGMTRHSIFKGIHQVSPGHYLTATPNGNINLVPYWDATYPDKDFIEPRSENQMIEQVRMKLFESVELRMHADVPVSVYLSGGLDSCAVMGIAAASTNRKIDAFTISFGGDDTFDERKIAERMAAHVGANMHVVDVQASDIADNYEDCVYHSETPLLNGNAVGKFLLSKLVREKDRKCVLTGEGSDEIFCGYPFFRSDYLLRQSAEERAEIWAALQSKNVLKLDKEADSMNVKLVKGMIGLYPTFLTMMCDTSDIGRCFTEQASTAVRGFDPVYEFIAGIDHRQVMKMKSSWDPVHTSMYLWSKSYLVNYLLVFLGDRCEMGHSVEGRLPFLDHELVELVNTMPLSMKLKNMNEKFVLREVAKPLITKEVYERQKHPFMSPPESLLPGSPMYAFMQETLRCSDVDRTGILDKQKIAKLLDKLHVSVNTTGPKDIPKLVGFESLLNRLVSVVLLQKRFNPTINPNDDRLKCPAI